MPEFEYVAQHFDRDGRAYVLTKDVLEAPTQDAAVQGLQGRGLTVLEIRQFSRPASGGMLSSELSTRDLIFFFQQTSMMLRSGVTLVRALSMLGKNPRSALLGAALADMRSGVEKGTALSDMMARHPKAFTASMIAVVRAGEASGALPDAMRQIADYLSAQEQIRKRVIGALTYPTIVLVVALAAVLFFSFMIVPTFANVFESLRLELPLLTKAVVGLSKALTRFGLVLLAASVAGFVGLRRFLATEPGLRLLAGFKRKVPVFSVLFEDTRLERFFATAAMLLKGGVRLPETLAILEEVFKDDPIFADALRRVTAETVRGKDFVEAVESHDLLPPMAVDSLRVAMESGKVQPTMESLAAYHHERVEIFTDQLATVLEPFVVVFIGALVGVLLFSLFLPVMKLAAYKPG